MLSIMCYFLEEMTGFPHSINIFFFTCYPITCGASPVAKWDSNLDMGCQIWIPVASGRASSIKCCFVTAFYYFLMHLDKPRRHLSTRVPDLCLRSHLVDLRLSWECAAGPRPMDNRQCSLSTGPKNQQSQHLPPQWSEGLLLSESDR